MFGAAFRRSSRARCDCFACLRRFARVLAGGASSESSSPSKRASPSTHASRAASQHLSKSMEEAFSRSERVTVSVFFCVVSSIFTRSASDIVKDGSTSITALVKSSPPRFKSPAVEMTSAVRPPTSTKDTSSVPPPRSKTMASLSSFFWDVPCARAANSGSFAICTFCKPALYAAASVALLCEGKKHAGTPITAFFGRSPRKVSQSVSNESRTHDDKSTGLTRPTVVMTPT
mmetsp:Transcript_6241/g.17602  ORF Transcript_6241/g.17602 Transcript_6241/m.17602 type:complete len:231 (-) Transcript_6241:278-970(-)